MRASGWIALGVSLVALVVSLTAIAMSYHTYRYVARSRDVSYRVIREAARPTCCPPTQNATPAPAAKTEREKYRAVHLPWAAMENPEMVAQLIKNGQDVNARDEDGRTALHFAVLQNHYQTAKLLLDKGAHVNVKEHSSEGGFCGWGWYPLHLALRNENMDMVKLLISRGANVNALRTDKWIPMCTAAYHGQPDVIEYLISKGAKVNYWFSEPLCIAADQGKFDAVKVMLRHGANVNAIQQWDGQSALELAAGHGNLGIAKLLINKKAKINVADKEGKTPLFEAASSGHVDTVKLLVSKGANVNARTKANVSVLHAAKSDEVRTVLLRHGARE